MHISEGVLSWPVLATGGAVAFGGVAYGLRKIDYDRVPQVAVLSAAFFVASLIHVPVGPASVHLILNGLCGLLLGWAAFPAIFVALLLQAVLFQHGGITTLGVNTVNMALPAVICFYLFGGAVRARGPGVAAVSAFACGFGAVLLSGLMVAASLLWTEESFLAVAGTVFLVQLPVMAIEGAVTACAVLFLRRVEPGILEVPHVPH